jgi:hypothetical protein
MRRHATRREHGDLRQPRSWFHASSSLMRELRGMLRIVAQLSKAGKLSSHFLVNIQRRLSPGLSVLPRIETEPKVAIN